MSDGRRMAAANRRQISKAGEEDRDLMKKGSLHRATYYRVNLIFKSWRFLYKSAVTQRGCVQRVLEVLQVVKVDSLDLG